MKLEIRGTWRDGKREKNWFSTLTMMVDLSNGKKKKLLGEKKATVSLRQVD